MEYKDQFRLPSRTGEADLSISSASKVQLSAEDLALKFGSVYFISYHAMKAFAALIDATSLMYRDVNF